MIYAQLHLAAQYNYLYPQNNKVSYTPLISLHVYRSNEVPLERAHIHTEGIVGVLLIQGDGMA